MKSPFKLFVERSTRIFQKLPVVTWHMRYKIALAGLAMGLVCSLCGTVSQPAYDYPSKLHSENPKLMHTFFVANSDSSPVKPLVVKISSLEFADVEATTCTITSNGSASDFPYPMHYPSRVGARSTDLYNCEGSCSSATSTCFLGYCLCHPGYGGQQCDLRKTVANPWYTAECPNLQRHDGNTLDLNTPVADLGGMRGCSVPFDKTSSMDTGVSYCAHLCFSHESYGVAIVPFSIWQAAQNAESRLWKETPGDGDRYEDHWEGFQNYDALTPDIVLGSVIEFGAGPWTQFRGILHVRSELRVKRYTVFEPGADGYMKDVVTCAYRSGTLRKYRSEEDHSFPVSIVSAKGETSNGAEILYDTVISINVIEHVQNAVEYLHSLHAALRPGGVLIFHDRFYATPPAGDNVLGANVYHPIRLTKLMFDVFLSDFDIIFNNCDGHNRITGWKERAADEYGYYVIARKKRISL